MPEVRDPHPPVERRVRGTGVTRAPPEPATPADDRIAMLLAHEEPFACAWLHHDQLGQSPRLAKWSRGCNRGAPGPLRYAGSRRLRAGR